MAPLVCGKERRRRSCFRCCLKVGGPIPDKQKNYFLLLDSFQSTPDLIQQSCLPVGFPLRIPFLVFLYPSIPPPTAKAPPPPSDSIRQICASAPCPLKVLRDNPASLSSDGLGGGDIILGTCTTSFLCYTQKKTKRVVALSMPWLCVHYAREASSSLSKIEMVFEPAILTSCILLLHHCATF